MTPELRQIATRVRRQTGNRDILALCDAVLRTAEVRPQKQVVDRKDYMRAYMRQYRAKQKLDKPSSSD